MFVMSNVLQGAATVLDTVLWLYMWVIIARALISWVNPDPWNPIVQFLERATEPVLAPIRRLVGMAYEHGSLSDDRHPDPCLFTVCRGSIVT